MSGVAVQIGSSGGTTGEARSLELLNRLSSSRTARTNQRTLLLLIFGAGMVLVIVFVLYMLSHNA